MINPVLYMSQYYKTKKSFSLKKKPYLELLNAFSSLNDLDAK